MVFKSRRQWASKLGHTLNPSEEKDGSNSLDQLSPPIIIGGNGGSGTRVVAEILISSGIYLGHDLNLSKDNLLFTYLFKHPYHFAQREKRSAKKISDSLILHEKLLFGHFPSNLRELLIVLRSGWDHASNHYDWKWVLRRWRRMAKFKLTSNPLLWGWKEPQSIFFLDNLKSFYPQSKFILVIRNGLDMTFTKNTQQMAYWGSRFKINSRDPSPKNKFEYWYRSNMQAITKSKRLFGDNFLIVKLEDLCLNRTRSIRELLEFVGLNSDEVSPQVWKIPQLPKSYRRYRKHDTTWVNSVVKRKLSDLGYE